MKTLLVFFALFGLLFAEIPSPIRRGHFEGRSGNIAISPKPQRSSSGTLLLDHYRHTRESIVTDINIGNLIAHLFQTPPPSNELSPQSIDRSSFPVLSLFSAPIANVFVTIQDVSSDVLSEYHTLSLLKEHRKIKIESTYQSHNSLTDIETFITSVPPSSHGIVGRSWMSSVGTETNAFLDMGAGSLADSVFDVLAVTSPKSLILSMSSDEQVASAIGVRVRDRLDDPNVLSFTWNSNRQSFGSIPKYRGRGPIQASRADILSALSSRGAFLYEELDLQMDQRNMQVQVLSRTGASAMFDLTSEEDFRLFVELFFVEKATKALKKDLISYVNDEHPDSFALSFASISGIRSKYGEKSPQFAAALFLVDAAVNSFFSDIQFLYRRRATTEVIFVSPTDSFLNPSTFEKVEELVSGSVASVKAFWPEIHMGGEFNSEEEGSLVEGLNDILKEKGFAAYWFGKQEFHSKDLYLTGKGFVVKRAPVGSGGGVVYKQKKASQVTEFNWNVYKWFGFRFNWSGVVYTQAQVESYQIQFWTSFFLIIITLGSCCSLCLLNPEKNNETLYRQTALGRETDTIPGGEYDFQPM